MLLMVGVPASAGEDVQQAKQAAVDIATTTVKKEFGANAEYFPGWLRRTDFVFDFQENNKPSYSIESIQPLYESNLDTTFIQGRAAYSNNNGTYNIGAGYRRLLQDKTWMFGLNSFYDRTSRYQHQRWGVGAEVFNQYATFRANYYDAFTGAKTTLVSGGNTTTERALDGGDISLETPVPFLPWAVLTAEGFYWKTINLDKNIKGWTAGLRMYPMDYLEIEAGYTDDNIRASEAFVQLTWHFGGPDHIEHTLYSTPVSHQFMNARNLENFRLEKVRRHHDIVVEKETTNAGISIGRRA